MSSSNNGIYIYALRSRYNTIEGGCMVWVSLRGCVIYFLLPDMYGLCLFGNTPKECTDFIKPQFYCWNHIPSYAAFLRGFSSDQRSETDNSRALAIALRQYRDLVMPLIVWWIVTRCRLHLRPISAADKPFFHISVRIFNSMSNMYLLYSHYWNSCQDKNTQNWNMYYEYG
jgi:hypothetical protein